MGVWGRLDSTQRLRERRVNKGERSACKYEQKKNSSYSREKQVKEATLMLAICVADSSPYGLWAREREHDMKSISAEQDASN